MGPKGGALWPGSVPGQGGVAPGFPVWVELVAATGQGRTKGRWEEAGREQGALAIIGGVGASGVPSEVWPSATLLGTVGEGHLHMQRAGSGNCHHLRQAAWGTGGAAGPSAAGGAEGWITGCGEQSGPLPRPAFCISCLPLLSPRGKSRSVWRCTAGYQGKVAPVGAQGDSLPARLSSTGAGIQPCAPAATGNLLPSRACGTEAVSSRIWLSPEVSLGELLWVVWGGRAPCAPVSQWAA